MHTLMDLVATRGAPTGWDLVAWHLEATLMWLREAIAFITPGLLLAVARPVAPRSEEEAW